MSLKTKGTDPNMSFLMWILRSSGQVLQTFKPSVQDSWKCLKDSSANSKRKEGEGC